MTDGLGHVSVLQQEALDFLDVGKGERFCDLTLGAGGHAELILRALPEAGKLAAFDQDPLALRMARERLAEFDSQLITIESNFEDCCRHLDSLGWDRLDGVLMDIGVSSMQLDDPERGFSFQGDGPLDMRMSGTGETAAEFLAHASAAELEEVFRKYGEEPRARAIAARIVETRKRTRLSRTTELAELVRAVSGGKSGKIHPATRVFQALRVALNRELEVLESVLQPLIVRLRPGRRLVVISFQSLEDRIVKQTMREAEKSGLGRSLTKRPVAPSADEIHRNPRSRSARLRAFERT